MDVQVAIVGAGFGGLAAAIALRKAGVDDLVILERAEDLGGVWRENTYPGAACDIPSCLYSFSYDQRRDWSRPCSPQDEILDYLRSTADRHGLRARIRTGTEVRTATWSQDDARWTLETSAGEPVHARSIVLACGQLTRPLFPAVDGRASFAGPSFHSAEWDHSVELRGKRIAVVGTGASAIQFVPEIAKVAARVDVYQRTAPWILPRRNTPYAPWAKRLIERVPGLQHVRRLGILAFAESGIAGQTRIPFVRRAIGVWATWHMRNQVKDPALRAKVWPDYPIGCKRVLFSSHYLPALARPNVELVTDRIARISERGVVTEDGTEREVDVVIYGTGFRAHDFVAPMRVLGRDGRELTDAWREGARAHHGIAVSGFPNLFLMYGPNTNLGFGSIIVMLEAQARYVASAVAALRRTRAAALDVRPEVEERTTARVQERLRKTVWTDCESWYREGADGRIVNNWPGQMAEYVRATREIDLSEYELVREPVSA
ncbi:MAG TPA: NAD(P)/FAD-dependent oxidoreductase [Solirubrobacteraceae bacterium]|nr:NAD(P)/FAD-dependent oxidoreductase [Solirubrobacteraceae bacterium]